MKLPHPIPYQGSKRNLASEILKVFPHDTQMLIEPFAGSAAITIAAAYFSKAKRFLINDINEPLMSLWDAIINNPFSTAKIYSEFWHEQLGNEEKYYYEIRDKFNKDADHRYLLFLLAKCVKAAVRYNSYGEFNQSLDKRRLGKNPKSMLEDILGVSLLLKGKTETKSGNYKTILDLSTSDDLVYMDPPYQNTGTNGGFRYYENLEQNDFICELHKLNERDIPFILSYDGTTGERVHGKPLPKSLNLEKINLIAGRSSQATLLNRNEITIESLYLSPSLIAKLGNRDYLWERKNIQESLPI
jgi:DNA adenine methylase